MSELYKNYLPLLFGEDAWIAGTIMLFFSIGAVFVIALLAQSFSDIYIDLVYSDYTRLKRIKNLIRSKTINRIEIILK